MALKKKKKVSAVGGSAFGGSKAAKKITKKRIKKPARKSAKKQIKKKALKRKPALKKKPAVKKKPVTKKLPKAEGKLIGSVTHYFPHVQAAVIKMKGPLVTGETVKIKGHTTDIVQVVTSLQMDRVTITSAKKGDEIGMQVNSRVRQGDKVYKG